MTHGNEDQYPWRITVQDETHGLIHTVGVAAENGRVKFNTPPNFWSLDPGEADYLEVAIQAAADRARHQPRSEP